MSYSKIARDYFLFNEVERRTKNEEEGDGDDGESAQCSLSQINEIISWHAFGVIHTKRAHTHIFGSIISLGIDFNFELHSLHNFNDVDD